MGIGHYIKEIGRGRDGARALSREQAADLMGQLLDAQVSDLEVGAFCLAMRIKGETPLEMAGFLDATHQRLKPLRAHDTHVVVLPCYNGARKLPVLTPLLAHLLAREGVAVLMHGSATESTRVTSLQVLEAMGLNASTSHPTLHPGNLVFVPTEALCPGLKRLLDVRRTVGLRNPAHSLVKLMNPVQHEDASNKPHNTLLVSSYTHPEYAHAMSATFELTQARALLLRGTEGEVVADPRRCPQMNAFVRGVSTPLVQAQSGALTHLPELPQQIDAHTTANYIQAVLRGQLPVPEPIARQVQAIQQALLL